MKKFSLVMAPILMLWAFSLNSFGDVVSREIYRNASTAPVVSTAGAYSFNFQQGQKFLILGVSGEKGGEVQLDNVMTIDNANQGQGYDIILFNDEPVVTSTDRTALSIAAVEYRTKWVGTYSVSGTDFRPAVGASVASTYFTKSGIKLKNGSTALWGVMRSRGSPTFSATTDLGLFFNFRTL